MISVKVKDKALRKMLRGLEIRAKDTRPFFVLLANMLRNMVLVMFREGGGRYGRASWPPISPSMYETQPRKDGKGDTLAKKRYGTDGAKTRRFTPSSRPLQASGGYRMSFKTQSLTSKGLIFGSRLQSDGDSDLAYHIQFAGGKQRYVMPAWRDAETQSEVSTIFKRFAAWIAGGRK